MVAVNLRCMMTHVVMPCNGGASMEQLMPSYASLLSNDWCQLHVLIEVLGDSSVTILAEL